MHAVPGADDDAGDAGGNLYVAEAAGKGLLVDMGMIQHRGTKHMAVGGEDFELVGVMLPARIGVGNGGRKGIGVVALGAGLGGDDQSLAGKGCAGPGKAHDKRQPDQDRKL